MDRKCCFNPSPAQLYPMVINQRREYGGEDWQAGKQFSVKKSKALVSEVQALVSPFLKECLPYTPPKEDCIGEAPAVRLPDGRLAIAPDLRCVSLAGKTFWIEVKDKAQRFYFPDTGADLHQVLGWYDIEKDCSEPVLVAFRDPALESCLPRGYVTADRLASFKSRWSRFSGKFYGDWLSSCLQSIPGYPRIMHEKSREMEMNILYFPVNSMRLLDGNWKEIFAELDTNSRKTLPLEMKGYYGGADLIADAGIRKLAYGSDK